MARLVYACRFDVSTSLGDVAETYRDWLVNHYKKRRSLPEFALDPSQSGDVLGLPADHALSSFVYQTNSNKVLRIRWTFPDNNDTGLRWANEIRIGEFGEVCGIEHTISIESILYSIAPARLLFGSPRVIRTICGKETARIGEMRILARPYTLTAENYSDFVTLLLSDLRRIPLVVLAPYSNGEKNKIDENGLAQRLAGVAVVVSISDPELTWDFADEFGRQLSCFNGAARIYWPGFKKDSDPRSHRLLLGLSIEKNGTSAAVGSIERSIFSVAAFRFVPDQRISEIVRAVESAQRQKEFNEKRAAGDEFWSDYERSIDELKAAEQKIQELESENANLKENQQLLFAPGALIDAAEDSTDSSAVQLSSVSDALALASERMKNSVILDSARSSAADSPFKRPYDIFKALMDLDEFVDEWRRKVQEKGSGIDILKYLRECGWGKRSSMHISDTTKSKYKNDYLFEYKGERLLFEPHITLGSGDPNSCASVHFVFDQNEEKMVVAHVGKHLPNTKT